MKAYLEYLELYDYFGRMGIPKLGQADFVTSNEELLALAARRPGLSREETERLAELQQLLFRDRI